MQESHSPSALKTVQKVSSGCGPSPPPNLQESQSTAHSETIEPSIEINRKISTGTSPPPQDMSTQTYDVLPLKRSEEIVSHNEQPTPHIIRRSYSMVAQAPLMNRSDNLRRSYSRQSFSSDTQVFYV